MTLQRPTFYVEPAPGVAVNALLNVLEILGAEVIRSLPPTAEKANYIIIDFGRRKASVAPQNWVEAWYEARAELNVPGILVGLIAEEPHDPVPGASQIPVLRVLPEVLHLFCHSPRPINQVEIEYQKQPIRKRQAGIIEHDLRHLVNTADLSVDSACRSLIGTLNRISDAELQSELKFLLDSIRRLTDSALLPQVLRTALAKMEKQR